MNQKDKIIEVLRDGNPHSVSEIIPYVYGGQAWAANLTGRISELRRAGYVIDCQPDKEHSAKSWYQLKGKKDSPQMADWKRAKIIPLVSGGIMVRAANTATFNGVEYPIFKEKKVKETNLL